MSYDVYLSCPCCGRAVQVERHEDGGTYPIGGTTDADLNITWNYAPYYYAHLDTEQGIRWLYQKTGAEVAERLEAAIIAIEADAATEEAERERIAKNKERYLHANVPTGYWEPTRANAIAPLRTLLSWARQHPTAVFDGD